MDITIGFTETEAVTLDAGDAATMSALIKIADMQAELRALRDSLVHPNTGEEARIAASYVLTDIAEAATSLRFALEMSIGR